MVRPEEFDEVQRPRRTTVRRAREFFEAQRKRFDESQRAQAYQPSQDRPADEEPDEESDFNSREAQRLLHRGADCRQPVLGYRILEKLGHGGSATIFRALEDATGQLCALKLLYPGLCDDQLAVTRFAREGMTLIRLDNKYILRGHDFGFSRGFFFQVLELVEGRGTVMDVIDQRAGIPKTTALKILKQVGLALLYLEQQQLVHRDIKPANLLVYGRRGIKLCDFGLCFDRQRPPDEAEAATCGTIDYMSPEQARGQSDRLDSRTDLYSLGATLYHMVAYRPPFTGSSLEEVLAMHCSKPLDFSDCPGFEDDQLRRLVTKLMAKPAEDRYQSPSELLRELDTMLAQR